MQKSYWDSPSYGQCVWVVRLSNEEVFYQDDTDSPSWVSLKEYLVKNNLKIVHLGLKSFDHEEWLPPNKEGYYFSNGAVGFMGGSSIPTKNIGYVESNRLIVNTYRCPELLVVEQDERQVEPSDYLHLNE